MSYLYNVISELAKLGTLEIAFGGGETPSSKNFVSAISLCKRKGITPNFTCFGTAWLADHEKIEAASLCGGIGVSIHDVKDLNKITKIRLAVGKNPVITAQYVMQSTEESKLFEILDACRKKGIPVLLLGYKIVGFGSNVSTHKVTEATLKKLKEWQENYGPALSVDTAFVENHKDILTALDVSSMLITSPEGTFSCYIDAVREEIGPSSYGGFQTMRPLTPKLIQKLFQEF